VRIAGTLLLTALFVFGCATPPEPQTRAHKRTRPGILFPKATHEPGETLPASPPKPVPQQSQPSPPVRYSRPVVKSPHPRTPRTFALPEVIHHKDQSVMVRVPAGVYWVPSDNVSALVVGQNNRLARKSLPEFFIDRTEITVFQFKQFQPDYVELIYTDGMECPQCPAMGITWTQAKHYCQWAGKRLPTETEWEAAARGSTENKFPWGNQPMEWSGNLQGGGDGFVNAAPSGSFPHGASPLGALDMIGNVWEWVSTTVVLSPLTESQTDLASNSRYLVKGGSWRSPPHMATISYRNLVNFNLNNPTFGFRCAK
jgi:formylglycine-generating enzyme required for sulfatase activity